MNGFNIGAVSNLVGVSVHNLRMWDIRYGLGASQRSPGGQRQYSSEDVERLKLIKQCLDFGMKIGNVASMNPDQLKACIKDFQGNPFLGGQNLLMALISTTPYSLNTGLLESCGISFEGHFKNISDASREVNDLDIAVVEGEFLTEEMSRQLTAFKVEKNPSLMLFIYRLARQEDLDKLREMGVRPVRAPIAPMELEDILTRYAERILPRIEGPKKVNRIARKKFTREQLDMLAEKQFNINCECPGHISEIIKGLEAFELYTRQCENASPEDAQLHGLIHYAASQSRSIMEEVLQQVLEHEGISFKS